MVEFDQAEWGHGLEVAPSPTDTGMEFVPIEETRKVIPTNAIRMWTNPSRERLQRADMTKNLALIDFWLSSDQQKRIAAVDAPELTYQEYLDDRVKMILEAIQKYGDNAWWCICGEQDGGVYWPDQYFESKEAAYRFFEECILENIPGRYDTNRKMTDIPMMRKHYGVELSQKNTAMQVSKCFSTHYPYKWGCGLVWLERNAGLSNVQVGIAFMRGAAKQYHGKWGMDFSTWGGPSAGTCHFDAAGNRLAGVSASLLEREYLCTFHAGADFILSESSNSTFWVKHPDGKFKLSPLGNIAKNFGEYSLNTSPDLGAPHTPVAVMLEQYHGWEPGIKTIWGDKLPYTNAERMIDNFFELAFPGYDENGFSPKWSPLHPEGFGWQGQDQCRKLLADGNGLHEIEAGSLAASTWGDCIDAVLDDCKLDVLQKYPVLILLGGIKLTDELRERLQKYVENGGELIINTRQISDADAELTGVKLTGEVKLLPQVKPSWNKLTHDDGLVNHDIVEVTGKNAEVFVKAKRGYQKTEGPAIVCNKLGKGKVFTTTRPYMQAGNGKTLSNHCRDFLNWVVSPHLPIKVIGESFIQYTINMNGGNLKMLLINNSENAWSGQLVPANSNIDLSKAAEIIPGKEPVEYPQTGNNPKVTIDPYGYKIYEFNDAIKS